MTDKQNNKFSNHNRSDIKKVCLKDFCKLIAGGTPKTSVNEYWDMGTIPWMSSGEVNKERIYFTEKHITDSGLKNSSTKLLPVDTVIVALAGQGSTRGKVAISKIELCTNQSLCGILTNHKIHSYFLYYYLQTQYFKLRVLSSGDGTRGGLNLKIIGDIKIPLFPIIEQQKIATILSTQDKVIELKEKLISEKEKQKKYLMQTLLTGKKRLNGFSGEWKKVKLGDIGLFSSAGVDKKIYDGEDFVSLLNYLDVYKNDYIYRKDVNFVVTASGTKIKKCDVKRNDIFFTPTSETPDDIARTAVIMEDMGNVVYSYHIVRLRVKNNIDGVFIKFATDTDFFRKQAISLATGSGTRYVVSLSSFNNIEILLPPLQEQQAIAIILTTADREIELLKQDLEEEKRKKKSLMQLLLTGIVRVADC